MVERPAAETREVILGTAGHIDHGKTALVQALTGINTDRLPEEQRTGMTIDLGFAHLDLGGVRVSIVDVPGHEKFIKNMVAGATGVDLALLVIAADDSVMPQTLEHLETLELLGVTDGLIALTKVDLVSPEQRAQVEEEIAQWMEGTAFEHAEILPVSAVTGQGLEELRERLTALVTARAGRDPGAVFRLPIDRAFTIAGAGTVVTGSVLSGTVRVGDTLEVLPARRRVRVRGIQRHDQPEDWACSGQRAALNLAGIDYHELQRRHELATPGYLEPTTTLTVWLTCLRSATRSFKIHAAAHLGLGTGDVLCRLVPLDREEIKPGQAGLAQLHTQGAVVADFHQPFILRSAATGRVVGGGRVIRPVDQKIRRTDRVRLAAVRALHEGAPRERLQQALWLNGVRPFSLLLAARDTGLSPDQVRRLADELTKTGGLVALGGGEQTWRLHPETVARLETAVLDTVARHHAQQPLQLGLAEAELTSRLSRQLPEALWPALRQRLLETGKLKRAETLLAIADFEVVLDEAMERLKAHCREALAAAGASPPSLEELAQPPTTPEQCQAVLELLAAQGEVVKVAPDLWFSRAALDAAQVQLREAFRSHGPLPLSAIRDALGTTRKYAVPLSEYFDRIRFTRRDGDTRVVLG